jgi:hypothetical protein
MKNPKISRPKLVALAIAALALTLGGLAPTSANAAPAASAPDASAASALPVATSHELTDATPFCASQAIPLDEYSPQSVSRTDCFSTRGAALAVAMGDASYARVSNSEVLALTTPGGALNPTRIAGAASKSAAALSTPLMSIDYSDWHYLGASRMWYGGPNGCDSSAGGYVAASMPAGWDNVISSQILVATGGCDHNYHYDGTNRTGALIDCAYGVGCYYIGDAMNDRTSSQWWI